MIRRQLAAVIVLAAAGVLLRVTQAQTFKVEKFDIKGDGGTDYVAVEAATGRVFVSRATHMMVVEGATGKVLGDIPDTPGVHGAGLVTKAGHGFTTNGGDQTVTMFDLKTLAVIKKVKIGPGLDGIMYDEPDDKVILTNHSRPIGTLTALDPKTGDVVATVELEDNAPESKSVGATLTPSGPTPATSPASWPTKAGSATPESSSVGRARTAFRTSRPIAPRPTIATRTVPTTRTVPVLRGVPGEPMLPAVTRRAPPDPRPAPRGNPEISEGESDSRRRRIPSRSSRSRLARRR